MAGKAPQPLVEAGMSRCCGAIQIERAKSNGQNGLVPLTGGSFPIGSATKEETFWPRDVGRRYEGEHAHDADHIGFFRGTVRADAVVPPRPSHSLPCLRRAAMAGRPHHGGMRLLRNRAAHRPWLSWVERHRQPAAKAPAIVSDCLKAGRFTAPAPPRSTRRSGFPAPSAEPRPAPARRRGTGAGRTWTQAPLPPSPATP